MTFAGAFDRIDRQEPDRIGHAAKVDGGHRDLSAFGFGRAAAMPGVSRA
jgi:hypothetical protein